MSVEKTNENFINFQVPVKLLSEYDSDQDSPTSTPGQSEGPGMSITSSKLKIDTLSKLQRYQDQDQKSETAQGQEFSERYNNSSSGESLEFKHPAGKNDQKYEECDDEDSNNFLTSKNNFTTFTSMKSFNFLKYPTSTNKLPPCFTPVLQRGQSGMSFADSQMEVKRTLERSEQQQKELQAQINTLYKSFNIVKKGDSTQDGENTTLELEEYTEDEEDSGDLNEVLSISSAFERENAQEKVFDLVRKVAKRVLQPSNFEFSKLRVDFKLPSFDPGVDYGQAIEKSKEVYRRLVELKAESSLQKMILEARIEKSENSIKVLKNFSQTRKKNRRFNFEIEKVHNVSLIKGDSELIWGSLCSSGSKKLILISFWLFLRSRIKFFR